jgi:hypothetical protein
VFDVQKLKDLTTYDAIYEEDSVTGELGSHGREELISALSGGGGLTT